MKTVNSLPEDYEGKMEVLINDPDAFVATRNLLQLLLLGDYPVDDIAVEAALHYWVSAALPLTYSVIHSSCLYPLRKGGASRMTFGKTNSSLGIGLSNDAHRYDEEWFPGLDSCFKHTTAPGVLDPLASLIRGMAVKSLTVTDDQDRVYAQVTPPHRVALKQYHQTGTVLPFGATQTHYSASNRYLFYPVNKWTAPLGATPLQGWE